MNLVSIIVPIYNVEQYLRKCLNSIIAQKYQNWECILVDDCSPDNSALICKEFCQKDSRFKYVKKAQNEGLGYARNTGLDNASGRYVSFIDSDDFIEPNFYTTLIPYAEKYGAVRCTMNIVDINGNKKATWQVAEGLFTPKSRKLWTDNLHDAGYTTCALYKKEVLDKNNVRFTKCPYREDSLFSFELFAKHKQLFFINKPLYNYYKRDTASLSGWGNMTKARSLAYLNAIKNLLEKLKTLDSFKYLEDIIIKNTAASQYIKHFCSREFNEYFPDYAYIDLVLPYVDSTDKNWINVFNKYSPTKIDSEINAVNRFRGQGDFFRYFFRCIAKNMPWINNIFLLVQSKSQVPAWLDQTKVKIITHEQFIPKTCLPTFNSGTIEMFLWNIPGLSNRFLYANDDFFMLTPVKETDFFDGNICKINFIVEDITKYSDSWRHMCSNNYNLIYNTNSKLYRRCDHEFRPYIKSKMIECFNLYKQQIYNSISQFRSNKNLTCFLFNLYLEKINLTAKSSLSPGYLGSNDAAILKNLSKNYVCLNDTNPNKDIYANKEIRLYFYSKFSSKCKYELNDTQTLREIETKKQEKVNIEDSALPTLDECIFW